MPGVDHDMKPDVRLALGSSLRPLPGPKPDLRLSASAIVGNPVWREALAPSVRLAHTPGAQGDNVLRGRYGNETYEHSETKPAILVSFVYLRGFIAARSKFHFRDWALDSGAFSAHNIGKKIDNQEYIESALKLVETDPQLADVFALDVIGDWEASARNTEEAWRQGLPAIPCYHAGSPEDALMEMAKRYPKIALGGVALVVQSKKMKWAAQCFARVWPKKIHGFAFAGKASVMGLPWHSVDSCSWELGAVKFGCWKSYGGQRLSIRGSKQNLRSEVEYYLKLERRARQRWHKEMRLLEEGTNDDHGGMLRPEADLDRS
jgi:hypothetical protein